MQVGHNRGSAPSSTRRLYRITSDVCERERARAMILMQSFMVPTAPPKFERDFSR